MVTFVKEGLQTALSMEEGEEGEPLVVFEKEYLGLVNELGMSRTSKVRVVVMVASFLENVDEMYGEGGNNSLSTKQKEQLENLKIATYEAAHKLTGSDVVKICMQNTEKIFCAWKHGKLSSSGEICAPPFTRWTRTERGMEVSTRFLRSPPVTDSKKRKRDDLGTAHDVLKRIKPFSAISPSSPSTAKNLAPIILRQIRPKPNTEITFSSHIQI
jgi:hypothetical protein